MHYNPRPPKMTNDPTRSAQDPEMTRIVAEEEKTLARVLANANTQRASARKDYDQELIELRDAIGEARMEDVPALLAEMERLRNVATRRAASKPSPPLLYSR